MISQSMEDYLKALYQLGGASTPGDQDDPGDDAVAADPTPVPTTHLANHLDVAPASATSMVKKLAERNLVEHTPYRGAVLTEGGRKMALEVLRHHRLLELYLMEALGYTWDEVHEEACRLEHAVSPRFVERIEEALGHPNVDPHGDPIPRADGSLPDVSRESLLALDEGDEGEVARVADQDPGKLRYLGEQELYPGTRIRLVEKPPEAAGFLRIEVGDREVVLGRDIAAAILVQPTLEVRA